MHGSWHDLLHLAAAAVLAGGGGIFVVLSFIARRRARASPGPVAPREPGPDVAVLLTVLAAVLSLAAAAVHLAAAPAHIADLGPVGWGFLGVAVFQASWALAYGIDASAGVARVAIAGNVLVVGAWLWSRTLGLPVGALAGVAEPVGTPDAAATVFELILVALLGARLAGLDGLLRRRVRDVAAVATMALVPAVGVVFLATTLAVGLAVGHSHDDGHGAADGHGTGPVGGLVVETGPRR